METVYSSSEKSLEQKRAILDNLDERLKFTIVFSFNKFVDDYKKDMQKNDYRNEYNTIATQTNKSDCAEISEVLQILFKNRKFPEIKGKAVSAFSNLEPTGKDCKISFILNEI